MAPVSVLNGGNLLRTAGSRNTREITINTAWEVQTPAELNL